jgi:hypothetical protein
MSSSEVPLCKLASEPPFRQSQIPAVITAAVAFHSRRGDPIDSTMRRRIVNSVFLMVAVGLVGWIALDARLPLFSETQMLPANALSTLRALYAVNQASAMRGSISVYDIDHGHRLVKTISTVSNVDDVRTTSPNGHSLARTRMHAREKSLKNFASCSNRRPRPPWPRRMPEAAVHRLAWKSTRDNPRGLDAVSCGMADMPI